MPRVIADSEEFGIIAEKTTAEVQDFVRQPNLLHIAVMLFPEIPGAHACMIECEEVHFTPGTPRNELFILHILTWEELHFGIFSIPLSEKHVLERLLTKYKLRLTKNTAILFSSKGPSMFPLQGEQLYMIGRL
jgi:hypothetical protein